jgi:hypothetical protein
MNAGRFFYRTPTGAMLWEIWARHRILFLWHGVALAAGLCFVQWKQHGASEIPAALMALAALAGFIGGYLQLVSSFAYVETDAAQMKAGFPARLLLKPLHTFHLVMVPMLGGGLATTTAFYLWMKFILKPLGFAPNYDLFWMTFVVLSFFWWIQALAWSLPLVRFRSFVIVAAALLHLVVGVMPQLPFDNSPARQWGILTALLVSAVPFAWVGLKLMRRGTWDGLTWTSILWNRWPATRAKSPRAKFRTAFHAQFWLEWQRQGWMLPGFSGALALLGFPFLIFVGFKWVGVDAPPPEVILPLLLIGPLFLSGVMGPVMARFDQLGPIGELPIYISVRPMTNGGFVLAKLAMALASSALTLLLNVAGICLCLAITGKWTLFSRAGLVTPLGTISYLTGCLPALLLLVIMVWKNLMAGIGTGLMGRPWLVNLGTAWRATAGMGVISLAMAANLYVDFREVLLHWLTAILIACLTAKIGGAIIAFVLGLRRNAITARAVGWMVGGWLACGIFVAGFARHICNEIHQPDVWLWAALGGFLILPLADLAIAPLALAWNRHR